MAQRDFQARCTVEPNEPPLIAFPNANGKLHVIADSLYGVVLSRRDARRLHRYIERYLATAPKKRRAK